MLKAANSWNGLIFLPEEVVYYNDMPKRIVLDDGAENLKFIQDLMKKYGIHKGLYCTISS